MSDGMGGASGGEAGEASGGDAGAASSGDPARAVFLVLVTGPDAATLREIGKAAVQEGLAACVNVVPSVSSVYRWEGRVMEEGEALAILKTTRDALPALERRVRQLHPYELPEFVALPVGRGSEAYLEWVVTSVRGEDEVGSAS